MRLLAIAASVAIGAIGAPALAEIGSMAAVNRDVVGARPKEDARRLFIRDKLVQNERITTSADSGGQVMFLDQTTLTLTPNSDIILDKYIFDPDADSGALSVTVLKGAMRLVGGRITKSSEATIKTPSVTIGIRGGMGNVKVGADGATEYMHIAGISATLTTPDQNSITITRSGGVAQVSAPEGGPQAFITAAIAANDAEAGAETEQAGAEDDEAAGGEETAAADAAPDAPAEITTTETAATGEGGEEGGEGPAITYLGVATREQVQETFGVRAGVGDGGVAELDIVSSVENGVGQIEQEISARPDAVVAPPVATTGERAASEAPQNETTSPEQIDEIVDEIVQEMNAISVAGVWSATAGLANGQFSEIEDDLAFRLQYSLTEQQGFVTVELPRVTAGDAAALTTFDNVGLRGDRFLIVGDDALNLVADGERLSVLGGDADGTALVINANDIANGVVFIDYDGVELDNLRFVDGEIVNLQGDRVTAAEIQTTIDALKRDLRIATD